MKAIRCGSQNTHTYTHARTLLFCQRSLATTVACVCVLCLRLSRPDTKTNTRKDGRMAPIGRNYCPFALVLKQITHTLTHTGTGEKKTHSRIHPKTLLDTRTHTHRHKLDAHHELSTKQATTFAGPFGRAGEEAPSCRLLPYLLPQHCTHARTHTHTVAFPLHRITALPSCAVEGSQGPSSGDDGECKSRYSFTAHFPFASAIAPANDSRHGLARNGVTFCTERGCVCVWRRVNQITD